jgi:hypothetical protein
MKTVITSTFFIVLFLTTTSYSQGTLKSDFSEIQQELIDWDVVRGEWLSQSILAIAQNNPIPDRTFPEDFTPFEMLNIVPFRTKEKIQKIATNKQNENRESSNKSTNTQNWTIIYDFINRLHCTPQTGRSFGDPHFTSFDGNNFSLQTVGEFILTKSKNESIQIQARQKASSNDFSLNTAIAMNVSGDRLCIYADDKPDSDISTPIRLNGKPIHATNSTYYLPHGGTIRNKGNEYIVSWPTGEKTSIQMRNSGNFGFMNITTLIYPCISSNFEGVLGNANGTPNDDLNVRENQNHEELFASMDKYSRVFGNETISAASNNAEKEYQNKLMKNFGSFWRVTTKNTLFDYGIGLSTASYTDLNFPTIHRTIGDLTPDQISTAKRNCENDGVRENEIRGCIYDNAFLNIPPSPRPVFKDQTDGVIVKKIQKEDIVRNVNKPYDPTQNKKEQPIETIHSDKKPISEKPEIKEVLKNSEPQPQPLPQPQVKQKIESTTQPKTSNPSEIKSIPSKINSTIFEDKKPTPIKKPSPSPSPIPQVEKPAQKTDVKINTPENKPAKVLAPKTIEPTKIQTKKGL